MRCWRVVGLPHWKSWRGFSELIGPQWQDFWQGWICAVMNCIPGQEMKERKCFGSKSKFTDVKHQLISENRVIETQTSLTRGKIPGDLMIFLYYIVDNILIGNRKESASSSSLGNRLTIYIWCKRINCPKEHDLLFHRFSRPLKEFTRRFSEEYYAFIRETLL